MIVAVVGRGAAAHELAAWVRDAEPAQPPLVIDPDSVGDGARRYVLAVADPVARGELAVRLDALGWRPALVVHPMATIGEDVVLGPGTVVGPGARLTTNVRAGRHTRVEPGATVSHDCRLGSFVTIGAGANVAGACALGDGVWVRAGAAMRQGTRVGDEAIVDAGAAVVAAVGAGCRVTGVPARLTGPRSTSPGGGGR